MKRIGAVIMLALGLPFLGSGVSALELLTPSTSISTHTNHLVLVGTTSAPIVEVYINDNKLGDYPVRDSIFHVPITYGYGLNEIRVSAVNSGVVETTDHSIEIEVLCGPAKVGHLHLLFPEYVYHQSEGEALCFGCHNQELSLSSNTTAVSYCRSCHRTAQGSQQHSKMADKDCKLCHLQEGDTTDRHIIRKPSSGKCFSCHKDKIESFNQKYVHGPVAGGACVVCHDPHGSKYEHSLNNAEEILCFGCHEFTKEFTTMPVQHPPFATGRCGRCHDPHATANRWVLVKSSETVCLECHDPDGEGLQNHNHPYNVKPVRPLTEDLKLSSKGRLECLSCHNPHATHSEHLLRINQKYTCIGCHSDKH